MHDSPYWTQFLNARTEEDLNELRNLNDPVINQALQLIDAQKIDPVIQHMVRMREDAMHEEASALAYARRKGIEKGRKEGLEIGRKEGAEMQKQKMLEILNAMGLSDELIMKLISEVDDDA